MGAPVPADDPRSLGDSLDELMKSLRGTGRRAIGGVFAGWDEAVGPLVSAHVQPVRLDGGVLTVEVDDPTWATQVRLLHDDLVLRVAESTGVRLDRIEVRTARRR
jgi:predicted nucleic acid-binding Zn ribbon protein